MEDFKRNGSSTEIIQGSYIAGYLGVILEIGAVPGTCNLTLNVQSCPEMEHMNVFKNSVRKGPERTQALDE